MASNCIKCEKCGRNNFTQVVLWTINHNSGQPPRYRCELCAKKTVPESLQIQLAMEQMMGGVTVH